MFLKMNTRHQAHKPVKTCNYWGPIFETEWSRGSNCISLPNFVAIGATIAEIWRYFNFSSSRPSTILDLLCVCSDHPRRAFGGVYRRAKFGWNLCSSFDNMHVFRCHDFGLGSNVNEIQKRHILARVRVVWAIMRENPSTRLICRWVPKNGV